MKRTLALCSAPLLLVAAAHAQGGPPGGGLGGPLPPPPVPAGNPITTAKALLGKALFWDEQLSSTRTVACGTCHFPTAGGSDPRAFDTSALNPGPDGQFGTPDDIAGSPGVPATDADGSYVGAADFGLGVQSTGRRSMSAVDAAFADELFWDGRAPEAFVDPETNAVVLGANAALESQAVGPLVSDVEMGHVGRDFPDVMHRIESSEPLALASDIPAELADFVAGRTYEELFDEAFGSPDVTTVRVAMAIATYERTLISGQTPLSQFGPGNQGVLTQQEQQGRQIFIQSNCAVCHGGPRLTDDNFRYIGVRPQNEDLGRFGVTGNNPDRGRMKTPSLLNVELRAPYFHNGGKATLAEVVDFYNGGGDFDAPNKAPQIQPLGLTPNQRNALVAFLGRPLTDPRVRDGLPPFDRPTLFSETANVPQHYGAGTPGTGNETPRMIAFEPGKLGNPSMTLAIENALGGAPAVLLLDTLADVPGTTLFGAEFHVGLSPNLLRPLVSLSGMGAGGGFGSHSFGVGDDPTLIGTSLFAQWMVFDPESPVRFAATDAVEITVF